MDAKYNHLIIILLPLLLISIFNNNAAFADPSYVYCNEDAKINNPKTSENIDNLLAKLVSATIQDGFSTASYGKGEAQVYGLGLCRADVSRDDCSACMKDAAKEIRSRCSKEADARLWNANEYCFLRYDTEKFFGELDSANGIIYYNTANVTDPATFNKELKSLTDKVRKEAVQAGNKGLGKGKRKLSDLVTLYALAQCTRDLSPQSCTLCLAAAIGNAYPSYCYEKQGCRSISGSCYVRYELYPFFFPLDPNQALGDDNNHNSVLVNNP